MKYIETAIKNILISLWTSLSGQCQRLHLTINPPRKVNGDSQRMGECLGAHFVPFCPYLFRGLGGSWSGSYCRCFFVCSVWWGSKGTVCSLLLCDLPCLFICTHTHTHMLTEFIFFALAFIHFTLHNSGFEMCPCVVSLAFACPYAQTHTV